MFTITPPAPRARSARLALIGLITALCAIAMLRVDSASALSCPPSPLSSCLPGSGYTGTPPQWNCGVLAVGSDCWSRDTSSGTTSFSNGTYHSWGWGSADYDGGGSTTVTICAKSAPNDEACAFGAGGTNLARACYYASCNDQDSWTGWKILIATYPAHTIYGKARY